jgi:hypothetical protein
VEGVVGAATGPVGALGPVGDDGTTTGTVGAAIGAGDTGAVGVELVGVLTGAEATGAVGVETGTATGDGALGDCDAFVGAVTGARVVKGALTIGAAVGIARGAVGLATGTATGVATIGRAIGATGRGMGATMGARTGTTSGALGNGAVAGTLGVVGGRATDEQSLAAPGVPKSPSPYGVVERHQLAPTLLFAVRLLKAIEAPARMGNPFSAQLTRSTRRPVASNTLI